MRPLERKNNTKHSLENMVFLLLGLGLDGLVFEVEEDEAEDKDANHHAEGRGIVGRGRQNEALVLKKKKFHRLKINTTSDSFSRMSLPTATSF
jgi:hypothetical protein